MQDIKNKLDQIINILRAQLAHGELFMSKVTDDLAAITANLTSIATGVTSLDAQIQALQNSPGTLSSADQAALDSIVAQSSALATAANAVVSAPTTPVPPVTPTP